MSQFRKTGTHYVSEWGGNSLNPGTAIAPYAHPANIPDGNPAIIGSGVYKGIWSGAKNLNGDGFVIIDCQNNVVPTSTFFFNVWLKNVANLTMINGSVNFLDCIIENCVMNLRGFTSGNPISHIRCLYVGTINCSINNSLQGISTSMVIGTIIGNAVYNYLNCFISSTSFVHVNNTYTALNNCMINGRLFNVVNSTFYELKRLFDGSPRLDANPTILDAIDIFPNIYANGNFAGDPKIIDVISRTVEPNSDLLRRSTVNGFIGGAVPGQYIKLDNSNFTITYQNMDTSNPNILRVADGANFGKVRITGKVSDTLISSQAVDIRIPFFFDSSQAGGSALNNNVPDSFNGLRTPQSDTLGDLPQRLRFQVRTSQLANANRSNNDDWDNDITGIPGNWYLMEYGQPMLHHIVESVAYGNADKFALNAPTKVPFNYRSIDMEITLSNTRSQV